MRHHALWLLVPLIATLALASELRAIDSVDVRVAASERYERGRVHQFALGGGYRELWIAEISLPLLDLEGIGGGLTATGRFGGQQTAVLAFEGADGRAYTFRGTDKDPAAVLDPELHDTIVQTVVQDQMAAQHPGGPLAAAVVSEAAGVLTIHQRMVVMPDDARLGDYREEFAGMVGSFYEYPTAASEGHSGFAEATEIIDHEELYELLGAGYEDRVDSEAFLRARLVDLLLGDFDRHRKQWRWGRLPGKPGWQPIPEDRDMAFVRYEGVFPRLAYLYVPILQNYGPDYPWMKGLTLHGWEQDRWILPALSWNTWERVARDIRERVSDQVIDRAVAALPPEYAALDGERLRTDLRGRRDRLLEGARHFYEHLAREVDIQGTGKAEHVSLDETESGQLRVSITSPPSQRRVFERVFEPGETQDVRIYLRGGDDTLESDGVPCCIRTRIIADSGSKRLEGRADGIRLYDQNGVVDRATGSGAKVDERAYEPPASKSGFVDVEGVPPRDWGYDLIPLPEFGFEDDVGAYIGLGAVYTDYGFRKHPWSSRHRISAGYATEAKRPRVRYAGSFRAENADWMTHLDLQYSGIEILRFYGFGNETNDRGSDSFFRVKNEQARVAHSLAVPLFDKRLWLSAGPWLSWSRTFENSGRLIDRIDPYGAGRFGSIGAQAGLRVDTRESLSKHRNLSIPLHDNPAAGNPTKGILLELTGDVSPPVWNVSDTWGAIKGSLSGFFSVGENARATLALRVGGRRTFGRTPYYAGAYIGGGEFFSGTAAIRGFRAQRFGGRGAVYGNADLRVFLVRAKVIVPADLGVLGFGDVGRVFANGENSDVWHPSGGGGVWIAPLTRTNTISFSVGRSVEDTLFYLRLGFHY